MKQKFLHSHSFIGWKLECKMNANTTCNWSLILFLYIRVAKQQQQKKMLNCYFSSLFRVPYATTLKCTTTYGIITINGTVLVYVVRITIQFSIPTICEMWIDIYTERFRLFHQKWERKARTSKSQPSAACWLHSTAEKSISNCSAFHFRFQLLAWCYFFSDVFLAFFVETKRSVQFAFRLPL